MPVDAASLEQLVVGAVLGNAPALEHDDPRGVADRAEPVGDDERRATLEQRADAVLDRPFGLVVQRRGRLIEDQYRRLAVDSAGDGDPLDLAARQAQAGLAHVRVVAEGEALDELGRVSHSRCPTHALGVRLRIAERDVAGDCVVEQVVVLENESDP